MFFLPTLLNLKEPLWILCLTTGNYDGLGEIRRKELECVVLEVLRVPLHHLIILDDEGLFPDHPTKRWPQERVASEIDKAITEMDCGRETPLRVFTFDEYGVSGHVNHKDTFAAVQNYVRHNQNKKQQLEAWALVSFRNPIRKYVPMWEWLVCLKILPVRHDESYYQLHKPFAVNWKAMQTHRSQFVWYRRLFVIFSCYTYCNRYKAIT